MGGDGLFEALVDVAAGLAACTDAMDPFGDVQVDGIHPSAIAASVKEPSSSEILFCG